MLHREVRTVWILIYGGWLVAFVVWGAGLLVGGDHLGQLAILIAAGTATLDVREFFVEHDESVRNMIQVLRLGDPDGDGDNSQRLRRLR